MKKKLKLKGQLRSYLQWPLYLTVLLAAMNIWIYTMDVKIGMLMSLFVGIYAIVIIVLIYIISR